MLGMYAKCFHNKLICYEAFVVSFIKLTVSLWRNLENFEDAGPNSQLLSPSSSPLWDLGLKVRDRIYQIVEVR